ncbi:MAG: hypothetical protein WD119_00995 [Pirellulaceae bacterium]
MRPRFLFSNLPIVCLAAIAFTWGANAEKAAHAEPPRIGGTSPFAEALGPLNPTRWSMPKISLPGVGSEKRVIRRKSDNVFDGFSKSVSRGWTKTKNALDPSPLWSSSTPRSSQRDQEPGFWTKLFSSDPEPKKIETVNDYLRQPRPY